MILVVLRSRDTDGPNKLPGKSRLTLFRSNTGMSSACLEPRVCGRRRAPTTPLVASTGVGSELWTHDDVSERESASADFSGCRHVVPLCGNRRKYISMSILLQYFLRLEFVKTVRYKPPRNIVGSYLQISAPPYYFTLNSASGSAIDKNGFLASSRPGHSVVRFPPEKNTLYRDSAHHIYTEYTYKYIIQYGHWIDHWPARQHHTVV